VPEGTPPSDTDRSWIDRLQVDLESPTLTDDWEGSDCADRINYAAVEFELDRMKKKLAIWEIFARYMRDGADSWPQVQRALSSDDINEIVRICDGVSLRDILLDSE
jgi:hypothetical protein